MNCSFKFVLSLSRLILIIVLAIGLVFFQVSPAGATPVSAANIFSLGVEMLKQENYTEAVVKFTEAIQIQKDYAAAYSNRCLCNLQLQDLGHAVSDCNQAINLAPENIEAYINRGIAYYRQGNYTAAIDDMNHIIALDPHDFRAYYNRGIATAAKQDYNGAITDYHRALSLVSETHSYLRADIYNDLGLAKFHLKDYNAATINFTLAIRLNPQSERAYFNRGCTCGKSGDNLGAVNDFNNTVKLNPNYAQAYANRGIAYHNLGYEQAAISDLQTAAAYFGKQGKQLAYQKTLSLIKIVQRQIPTIEETA
ncbi:TPR repeat-containing protein [Calothrix sp. NIES-4071]|nr:TPR repeat-containing protein [Calothrix sp. NIES-4071]BAZ57471.1 TPR repeat-containing protein [Calothrix sp. NIES-4105]